MARRTLTGLLFLSALAGATARSSAQSPLPSSSAFDDLTLQKLEQALSCVNLSTGDLGWDKRPISDEFRLSCVNETLDRPLSLADRAVRAESEFAGDPVASARAAAGWLDVTIPPEVIVEGDHLLPTEATQAGSASSSTRHHDRWDRFNFPGAPREAIPLLSSLLEAYRDAEDARGQAMSDLSTGERKLLADSGARLYTDESDEDWDMAPILEAAKKVDIAQLARAETILAEASRQARALADRLWPPPGAEGSAGASTSTGPANTTAARPAGSAWKRRTWTVGGITIGLGGPGPDVHSETIVLDPGGDDVYTKGSVIMDLAGDDTYRGAGSGFLEIALLLDLSGNDRYLGGNFAQGGTAFGASLLADVAGDDRYEADQCSQGSAFFGVGMLFDLAGADSYRGARFVQGFGGTRGLGALSDSAGNDTYYAGGKYLHAPLLPENYQSLSQGFGFGLRGASASGGVGILADHAGNDVYSAEVFGQGASYWFSLGVLVDSAGHDKYDLYQYGQGAGIHLSSGVLFDRAGNDAYTCNNGVAQGSGHDWGVGLLWDLAGDDCYQGSGMSQGGANANAIGMLVDRAGNDSYGGWNVKNQGDSFFSRGTIGLGVLLDLGGTDRYTHGGKDGEIWTNGTVGVGLDAQP